jgi:hypothetical protein
MRSFWAGFAYSENNGEVELAGLADDQFDTLDYILFQKDLNPSDEDVAMGHDQVHVTLGNGGGSVYGGVERIEVFEDRIAFVFDEPSSKKLDIVGEVVVYLNEGLENVHDFIQALQAMSDKFEIIGRLEN